MKKGHDKYCTKIQWLNSLTNVPSGVANCRNLPFGRRARRDSRVRPLKRKHAGVTTNVRKNKKRGLRILKIRVRELFTCGEGISTPHVRLKGRQHLIECANMTLIFMFHFMFLYPFYIFSFLWSTRVFPFAPTYSSICDEEIRPT